MQLIPYNQLSPEGKENLAVALDELLIDYQIYHENIQKIHWDQQYRSYLDLSQKVEILYKVTDANKQVLAEKILELGKNPTSLNQGSVALMKSRMSQLQEVQNFDEAIFAIVQSSGQLLETVQEVFYLAAEYDEKQTMAMMNRLAQQLHFTIWVFSSVRSAMNN